MDPSVRSIDDGNALVGGYPGRLLRLTGSGRSALADLLAGTAGSVAARRLGRRLVDAGMAHPRPPATTVVGDVTVVVPVRDRADTLDRCLSAVRLGTTGLDTGGTPLPVVVVDDGSQDADGVAEVCHRHGARLVVRDRCGGPAAARNDGLAIVETELVAFLDSDCLPPPGWLGRLVGLFADPQVGAVAPRVTPLGHPASIRRPSVLSSYSAARSPLDLGRDEGEVGPGRRVAYVPTAALVVRRSALSALRNFDQSLRYGEDVDLVWRLGDAGWHIRYVPSVMVDHVEPTSWRALLRRRYHYGTSAAPLSLQHRGRLAPVVLRPWPTAVVALLLARRPIPAAAVATASGLALGRQGTGIPNRLLARWTGQAIANTAVGVGHAGTVIAGPALVLVALGSKRYRWSALGLLAIPVLHDWFRRRPAVDPARWTVASLADDIAYGLGVWRGCVRHHTVAPLVPAVRPIR
jgi:mycofactocin glycosyltransferase